MNSSTTTEILKLDFHQTNLFTVILIVATSVFASYFLIVFYNKILHGDPMDCTEIGALASFFIIITIVILFNIINPLSLTKKTETKTEQFNIINVDNKLSQSNQLIITVKNKSGAISTKEININDENTLVKANDKDKVYTEKITTITYDTKQIVNSLFKKVPKDVRKKEITVYLPENLL